MTKKIYLFFVCIVLALPILLFSFSGCNNECSHKEFTEEKIPPTCSKEGYTLKSCKNCSYKYKYDFVSPTGHTLSKEIFAPLCEKEGYTYYSCECGYSYKSDFAAPMGHTFTAEKFQPTCVAQGYTEYACACGYEYKTDFSLPNGHSFKSETTPPTCNTPGHTEYTCNVCKYSYVSKLVAPTNHTIKTEITYPTSFSDGQTRTFCEANCGYEYISAPVRSEDVYKGAYANTTDELARGIDVSYWNETLNWAEIKAAGIDFVIIKAGSTNGKDPNFETNYKGAKAAGLDVGCYYYSYALNVEEALEDAKIFKEQISGKQFEYPVYLDIEDKSQENLDRTLLTDMCIAFIKEMQSSGYFCGLYVNNNWLTYKLDSDRLTPEFDIWLARWFLDLPDEVNWPSSFGLRTGVWQYYDAGKIGTHTEYFDLNIAFKNYPALIKGLGLNGF